jgi:hypothetical protein
MKSRFFSALAASAGIAFTACDKAELNAPATPARGQQAETPVETEALPSDPEPTAAEKKLAAQVQELEARELALQQQMEDERLAAADAEIAKEQELLQKEREAWALEQQLADAKAAPVEESEREAPPVADALSGFVNTSDYQTFYDDLEPQGSWYESPDYGYVWQPSIAISDVTWRPYTRGRWACADQGWTWCSDEPFGWACYHYGRWAKVRGRGWVWVPGDQWAPAWVCWRKTDKYIGWCPLPPETVYDRDITYGPTIDRDCGIHPGCYVFMPVRQFDQPVFSHCEVPSVCLSIYGTSINITNLIIRRHRVECSGPQYDWITECVRHPMPRYTLACESNRPDHRRSPLIEKDRLHCFAPKVYAPWNVTLRPTRTKANLAGTEVLRGEGGLPGKLVSHFQLERLQRGKEAENLKGVGQKIVEHQKKLASLEKTRETLEQSRKDPNPAVTGRPDRGGPFTGRQTGGDTAAKPGRQENSRLSDAQQEIARLRALRESKQPDARTNPPADTPNSTAAADSKEQRRLAEARAELDARREQLAKLRADREAAAKTRPSAGGPDRGSKERIADANSRLRDDAVRPDKAAPNDQNKDLIARQRAALEEQRRGSEAATRDLEKQTADRAALEEKRRQQQDAENKLTKDQLAQQRAALEQQRRAADAASRDAGKQIADRAALEEKRRQQEDAQNKASKEQIAQQRAALEQQRRAADAASREADRQKTERAAMEDTRRRQQEAANEQAKAQIAAQRAAIEQQRRQAEEQAKADRQAREQAAAAAQQREAMQREAQQRQANEQAARQQAMENQRRQAEEQQSRQENARRQAEENNRRQEENSRRQAEENNRRQAEENNRRQAEENNRRQAEESRRQADQRAKEAADRDSKKGGR